jgi:cation diffusion facilitator CzcD-associated flavoprotein CzcO
MHETPIYGKDGVSLDDLWNDEPGAYMSICPPQMPNLFLFVGPNGAPGAGSTIHMSECACDYMVQCIQKIQRQNLRWMMPKSVSRWRFASTKAGTNTHGARDKSLKAFMKQVDRYFAKSTFAFTVRTPPCSPS